MGRARTGIPPAAPALPRWRRPHPSSPPPPPSRRMHPAPSWPPPARLLDPANARKSLDQMVCLPAALGRRVELHFEALHGFGAH